MHMQAVQHTHTQKLMQCRCVDAIFDNEGAVRGHQSINRQQVTVAFTCGNVQSLRLGGFGELPPQQLKAFLIRRHGGQSYNLKRLKL